MNAAVLSEMQALSRALHAQGLAPEGGCVAVRADAAHVYIGRRDADFHLLAPEDIAEYGAPGDGEHADILRIFAARSDLHGLFLLGSPFCKAFSQTYAAMRASLDDTAQIAGGRIRTAASAGASDVLPCLRGNFACFIKGHGQLTVGRSLHEAYVAALVLEKGARAQIQAGPFGGAKPLGRLDCRLMRSVYLKKYSQIQEQRL